MRPEDRRTVAVAGFLHALSHGNLLAVPILLTAWSEFSTDPFVLGLLAATAYACFGLASVPFGLLADRRPARPMLLLCEGGVAASLVGVALSPSLAVLATCLAALGLASGIYHPTGLALISRTVREPGRGFGWHGMAGSLGVALGPAFVAGLLAAGWPWRTVVALLVVPPLAGLALVAASGIGRPVPAPEADPGAAPRRLLTPTFLLVMLVYTFSGVAYWGSLTFLPVLVGRASFVLLLALGAIGQVASGHLAERPRPDRTLFGLSLAAGGFLAALALDPAQPFLPAAWAFGFLLFSLEPLQNTLVTGEVPPRARGAGFGLTFLSVFGLGSVGSAWAGYLLAAGRPDILFLSLGASLAASGACALAVGLHTFRRRDRGAP